MTLVNGVPKSKEIEVYQPCTDWTITAPTDPVPLVSSTAVGVQCAEGDGDVFMEFGDGNIIQEATLGGVFSHDCIYASPDVRNLTVMA